MFGIVLLTAISAITITGLVLTTYIQYYEYASIEDIRKLLRESYLFLSMFEFSMGLCGLYTLQTLFLIQFLNWWIFYQGSQKYPYIFNMNSFFPIKMILITFIKAIISIKNSFKIPFIPLIFPYIIITVCTLPLLFAFSYPYEDSVS